MRVKGKVAIVTGAASGLGFAAAQKLLNEGAKVILTDINNDILNSMDERLSAFSSSQFKTYHHDVSSEESWKEVIDQSELDFEGINILINSAGISLGADIVSTDATNKKTCCSSLVYPTSPWDSSQILIKIFTKWQWTLTIFSKE